MRFLAHELYDELYAHAMTLEDWNEMVLRSERMAMFRATFERIIPNLERIGLLTDRVRLPAFELLQGDRRSARTAPRATRGTRDRKPAVPTRQ